MTAAQMFFISNQIWLVAALLAPARMSGFCFFMACTMFVAHVAFTVLAAFG